MSRIRLEHPAAWRAAKAATDEADVVRTAAEAEAGRVLKADLAAGYPDARARYRRAYNRAARIRNAAYAAAHDAMIAAVDAADAAAFTAAAKASA